MSDFLAAEDVIETGIQKVRAIADLITVLDNNSPVRKDTLSWIGLIISGQMDDMNNALNTVHALYTKQV
jgi:hypothetical protein